MQSGKIVQVIGPVVDVEFDTSLHLPSINEALVVTQDEVDGRKAADDAFVAGDGSDKG